MRKTAIFKDDLFLMHDPGPNHPERIDRLRVIYDFIEKPEHKEKFLFPDFVPALSMACSIVSVVKTPYTTGKELVRAICATPFVTSAAI